MSVDNFIQAELFADTFPPMTTKAPKIPNLPMPALAPAAIQPFRVIRSPRRKRTISAFRKNDFIEIHIPARTTKREEAKLIPEMIALVLANESKRRRTEDVLETMASDLLQSLLPEFHERPSGLTWRPMKDRWGSCTTVDRTIRISDRLKDVPEYVLRCVLFHELIHLRVPDHSKAFYELLERFPNRDRAEAYLDGYEAGFADNSTFQRKADNAPNSINPPKSAGSYT